MWQTYNNNVIFALDRLQLSDQASWRSPCTIFAEDNYKPNNKQ